MNKPEINAIIQNLNKFYNNKPPLSKVASDLGVEEEEAKMLLDAYNATKPKTTRKRKPNKRKTVTTTPKPMRKKQLKFHDIALKFLPWITTLISIIALVRSIIFTYNYFNRLNGVIEAIAISILFGLVVFIMPAVFIASIQRKNVLTSILSFIAFIIFAYMNVNITINEVDAMRNDREQIILNDTQQEVIRARNRVEEIGIELAEIADNLDSKKIEWKAIFDKTQANGIESWEYNRHRTNLKTNEADQAVLESKRTALREEQVQLTNIPEYYTMIVLDQSTMNNDRRIDLSFALALEGIGPIAVIVSMFL